VDAARWKGFKMKAYGLLALMAVVSLPAVGTPASAQTIPEELRRLFHERHVEFREDRDGIREVLFRLHKECEEGERRACVHLGMIIGENREHRAEWQREHPALFSWWRP
jgi:hypothetical protein